MLVNQAFCMPLDGDANSRGGGISCISRVGVNSYKNKLLPPSGWKHLKKSTQNSYTLCPLPWAQTPHLLTSTHLPTLLLSGLLSTQPRHLLLPRVHTSPHLRPSLCVHTNWVINALLAALPTKKISLLTVPQSIPGWAIVQRGPFSVNANILCLSIYEQCSRSLLLCQLFTRNRHEATGVRWWEIMAQQW